MNTADIRATFETEYKFTNFMTPDVYCFGKSGNWIYEISTGTDFERMPVYGVTVLYLDPISKQPFRTNGINRFFQGRHALIQAKAYARGLSSKYPYTHETIRVPEGKTA